MHVCPHELKIGEKFNDQVQNDVFSRPFMASIFCGVYVEKIWDAYLSWHVGVLVACFVASGYC